MLRLREIQDKVVQLQLQPIIVYKIGSFSLEITQIVYGCWATEARNAHTGVEICYGYSPSKPILRSNFDQDRSIKQFNTSQIPPTNDIQRRPQPTAQSLGY